VISEWFLQMGATILAWVGSLFPAWTPPAEFTQMGGLVSQAMGWFVGLGVWVPWSVLTACVTVQLAAWALTLSAKTVRAAVAHIPFVGGHGA
jgi:hypothetical protein